MGRLVLVSEKGVPQCIEAFWEDLGALFEPICADQEKQCSLGPGEPDRSGRASLVKGVRDLVRIVVLP
jgi:hypothetical protein